MAQSTVQVNANEEIEEIIKCPVCHDYCKDPRMLPCSHTLCLTCIRKLVATNNGQFDCPLRDGSTILGDTVDSLPINRAVRDLVEIVKRDETSINCCNCGKYIAILWCRDCQAKGFCSECHLDLHKLPAFADHRPAERKPPKIIKCSDHPEREIEFWCSDTKRPYCSICLLTPDVSRKCVQIDDVFNKIAKQLKNDFMRHPLSINHEAKLQEMFRKYEKSSTSKAAFIDEKFASMRRMIDEHEKIINEKRLYIDAKNRKAIEDYQLILFNKIKKLRQRWVLVDRIIDAADYIRLLQNQQRFEEELNELAAEFEELMDPVPIECEIEGLDKCLITLKQSLGATRVVEKPTYENTELEELLESKRNDDMINLNNQSFNDHDAIILARYLRKYKIPDNKRFIKHSRTNIEVAIKSQSNENKITTLHLGSNQIKATGVKFLADSLRYNRTLSTLELWNNQIGDEGAQYLADALRQNTTLTSLGLNATQIGNKGAQDLSTLLHENTVLTIVYLNNNLIGDEGAQYLIGALKQNKTLKQLHILQNPDISEKVRKQMKEQETVL